MEKCKFLLRPYDILSKFKGMEKAFTEMINMHGGIIYKVCNLYGYEKESQQDLFHA
jgi:hypothetical protein